MGPVGLNVNALAAAVGQGALAGERALARAADLTGLAGGGALAAVITVAVEVRALARAEAEALAARGRVGLHVPD